MRQKDSWDKTFEELTFTDDYIFKLVMEQPEIFKAVLGLILPEVEVEKLTSLETEKPFTVDYFFHGVRFDVLAKGREKFVDIEVQLLDTGELGERAMYYLSLLVAQSLKKGMSYRHLGESCVVFFCKFDPFGKGLPVYSFSMACEENPALHLTKNARIIFFNAAVWDKCNNAQLALLLRYMMTGEVTGDVAHKIDTAVRAVKQNRTIKGGWGMFYERMIAERNEGFDKGMAQGFDKGMAQGFDRGSRDTKIATARSFLAMGLSAQQVAQGTGLPIDEVQQLL